jgi:hypothetical protein
MLPFRPASLFFAVLAIGVSACSVAQESTPDTTTLALGPPSAELVLLDDGLEPFRFGDIAEAVVEGVTATIGGWNADSASNDAITPPVCEDGQTHSVSWGSLVLSFVERDGVDTFTHWAYGFDPLTANSDDNRQLGLTTPEGIGLGSVRNDLLRAYGSAVSITDDTELNTAAFMVSGNAETYIVGKLNIAGSSGTVDFLETTPSC